MARIPLEIPIFLRDHVNGIMHENVVSDFKTQGSATVNEAINMNFDRMGDVQVRKGTTLLGNQISAGTDILGLHQFLDEGTGTDDQLYAVNGTVVYLISGETWTASRTGLTSGKKADFTNFADRVMMVNGSDTPQSHSGTGSWDTTNLTSAPTGNFIENFRSRVWIANTDANPSRVFFTDVISSAGSLTWDTTNNFIDISPGDGEDITGQKRSPGALLVFKPNHIYRVFGTKQVDPDPQIMVGTYSNRSVVEAKNGYYFHDFTNSAIQLYSGGIPKEISKPIRPFLEGVSLSNRSDVAGWKDNDHVYESLGDITINSVTISNAVAVYTISTEAWSIYSYPTKILDGVFYDDGSDLEPVVGDDDGNVLRFNNGNTDNVTPITYSLVTRWHDLSGVRSYKDTINKLAVLHQQAQGASIQYQVDYPMGESDWKNIGELKKDLVSLFDIDITGNRVRFRVSGTSSGEQFVYEGIEILSAFSDQESE